MTSPSLPRKLATFADLERHSVFGSRLLEAKIHVQDAVVPRGYGRLLDIAKQCGGFTKTGDEPGNASYIEDSDSILLRTRCLAPDQLNVLSAEEGQVFVASYAFVEQGLRRGDIVIAKDGPVGNVGLVSTSPDTTKRFMVSSGIVHVRIPSHELFYFGLLKAGPFTTDVELLTPTSSTYAHAGRELVSSAKLPLPDPSTEQYQKVRWLAKLMVLAETYATRRYRDAVRVIDELLGTTDVDLRRSAAGRATFSELESSSRFDSAYHLALNGAMGAALQAGGAQSLEDLVQGGEVHRTRGQNLQVAQIGFSEKHDDDRSGSYRLLEPNFIRKDMGIEKYRRLSCARSLQTLRDGAVVMSAEGSIGRVTLYRDEAGVGTVSNIHAIQMDVAADGRGRVEGNAWLAASLVYLRDKGWLDAISVGGQGGSLAMKYHGDVLIPPDTPEARATIHRLLSGGDTAPGIDELRTSNVHDLARIARGARRLSHAELGVLRRDAESLLRVKLPDWYPSLY